MYVKFYVGTSLNSPCSICCLDTVLSMELSCQFVDSNLSLSNKLGCLEDFHWTPLPIISIDYNSVSVLKASFGDK